MSRLAFFTTTLLASALTIVPTFAQIETVTVTAKRLAEARNGIQTQLGASTYKITAEQIEAQPGGENAGLNQVILQAPGAAEDSFGQLHIRGEHNGLQYRVNGVIIPEGNTVFSQTLNPRLAQSVQLITGALPAEYGLRTAGIIDVQTKTGLEQGGQFSVYGGSRSEINPSFDYGGSSGDINYFASGDYLTNTLGIESPDGSVNPLHDRSTRASRRSLEPQTTCFRFPTSADFSRRASEGSWALARAATARPFSHRDRRRRPTAAPIRQATT